MTSTADSAFCLRGRRLLASGGFTSPPRGARPDQIWSGRPNELPIPSRRSAEQIKIADMLDLVQEAIDQQERILASPVELKLLAQVCQLSSRSLRVCKNQSY